MQRYMVDREEGKKAWKEETLRRSFNLYMRIPEKYFKMCAEITRSVCWFCYTVPWSDYKRNCK